MPVIRKSQRPPRRCAETILCRIRPKRRRISPARCKLDPSIRLIAPAHTLTLPSLDGVKDRFEFCSRFQAAVPLVEILIAQGLVREQHFQNAKSPAHALQAVLADFVKEHFQPAEDVFDVTITIAEQLEGHRPPENTLFFIWANAIDPQYIPLRPIYEKLDGNPHRDGLMASLYIWLYGSASRIFNAFGFDEAANMYGWRKECYEEARESGEDGDLEGEVESADPHKVIAYIRNRHKLALNGKRAICAIHSIQDQKLKAAFASARQMYLLSHRVKFPVMSRECDHILHEAAYYMDAYPMPALGISHWRDDPIVAWFDEFCREQFEGGETSRAPIILCFRPDDAEFFTQIINTLPRLIQITAGLSDWVKYAQEMENECDYANREPA